MDQALADLQALQNDMMARWQGPSDLGNYLLKPDAITVENWLNQFESIRQAMLAAMPAAAVDTPPPPKAKKP